MYDLLKPPMVGCALTSAMLVLLLQRPTQFRGEGDELLAKLTYKGT
jgi:hypothetical protein